MWKENCSYAFECYCSTEVCFSNASDINIKYSHSFTLLHVHTIQMCSFVSLPLWKRVLWERCNVNSLYNGRSIHSLVSHTTYMRGAIHTDKNVIITTTKHNKKMFIFRKKPADIKAKADLSSRTSTSQHNNKLQVQGIHKHKNDDWTLTVIRSSFLNVLLLCI